SPQDRLRLPLPQPGAPPAPGEVLASRHLAAHVPRALRRFPPQTPALPALARLPPADAPREPPRRARRLDGRARCVASDPAPPPRSASARARAPSLSSPLIALPRRFVDQLRRRCGPPRPQRRLGLAASDPRGPSR